MPMKKEHQILLAIAFAVALYFLIKKLLEELNKETAAQQIQPQQILIVLLSNAELKENTETIYSQLKEKEEWFNRNAPAFSKDMSEIVSLYNDPKLHDMAILKSGMFIESILKYRYSNSSDFKKWRSEAHGKERGPAKFERYIEYAKHINELTSDEYNFVLGVKAMRNTKAHNHNVGFNDNLRSSAFYIFLHVSEKYQNQNLLTA
jgi:hypothetical protein